MNWEIVIGLETHVELSTRTKAFCSCVSAFGGEPNTRCCPVCTGMPGALPVLNRQAVEFALQAGLALNCTPTRRCRFDRKNFFYPDLPKAYQISQLYLPLCRDGAVELPGGRQIHIHELHLEEDAGKLIHDGESGLTRIDFNRCGVPLIEIVTEPDFRTAQEVLDYLDLLRTTLQYLEVSDCKLQEGSLRCDVNLSVRPVGSTALGTRTEMKNLASFRAIGKAIACESRRQIALLEAGGQVAQETCRWDEALEQVFPMRAKERVSDYRYFPDPDLPDLVLEEPWLDALRARQPEPAPARAARYQRDWGLTPYDAQTITSQKALADFLESVVALGAPPKEAAHWIMGPILSQLSAHGLEAREMVFSPAALAHLLSLIAAGKLSRRSAVEVLEAVFLQNDDMDTYIASHGLTQVSDPELVRSTVAAVLTDHPQGVADWRAGKQKAFGFLMGQVMYRLQGRADPQEIRSALQSALDGLS